MSEFCTFAPRPSVWLAAAVPARANTVHIGRFLSIHSDGLGRSATHSGHDHARQAPRRLARHRRSPRPWHPRISTRVTAACLRGPLRRWRRSSGVAPRSKISSVAPGRGLISSRSGSPSRTRKSAEASPLIAKARASSHDRRRHRAAPVRAEIVAGRHRAAIAPGARGPGRRPLLAEAEHAGAAAIGDEERRNGTSRDAFLIVEIGGVLREPARHDMAAAGAAALLGEPRAAAGRRLACRRRMRRCRGGRASAKKCSGALRRATVAASVPSSGQRFGDQRSATRGDPRSPTHRRNRGSGRERRSASALSAG